MAETITDRWFASLEESERWDTDLEGETREEVIELGTEEAKEFDQDHFFIAKAGELFKEVPPRGAYRLWDFWIDDLYDYFHDLMDGAITTPTNEQLSDLDERLKAVFKQWVLANGLKPTVFPIIDVERINL